MAHHTGSKSAGRTTFGEVFASYGRTTLGVANTRRSYMAFAPQTRADIGTLSNSTRCLRSVGFSHGAVTPDGAAVHQLGSFPVCRTPGGSSTPGLAGTKSSCGSRPRSTSRSGHKHFAGPEARPPRAGHRYHGGPQPPHSRPLSSYAPSPADQIGLLPASSSASSPFLLYGAVSSPPRSGWNSAQPGSPGRGEKTSYRTRKPSAGAPQKR